MRFNCTTKKKRKHERLGLAPGPIGEFMTFPQTVWEGHNPLHSATVSEPMAPPWSSPFQYTEWMSLLNISTSRRLCLSVYVSFSS